MQYQGIAYKLAQEYLPYAGNAVALDDLLQAGAVGAIRAADTYDPSKGTWYKWCSFYIRQEMQALCGFRTSKVDAAHGAISLDEPLTEDGFILAETLADTAPTPEEDWDREAVASAVRDRVENLRFDRRWVVELVDLDGKARAEAAEELGITLPSLDATRREAFSDLRRDHIMLELAEMSGIINRNRNRYDLSKSRWAFMTERRKHSGEHQEQNCNERSGQGSPPRI